MSPVKLYQNLFVSFFLLLLTSCEDSAPLENDQLDFQNIAKTDETGSILEDDPDDWQPRVNADSVVCDTTGFDSSGVPIIDCNPIYNDSLMAEPAYPNPFKQVIALVFTLSQESRVTIEILDKPEHAIKTMEVGNQLQPGKYMYTWDGTDNSGGEVQIGIYRAIITAVTNKNTYSIYGDVEKLL